MIVGSYMAQEVNKTLFMLLLSLTPILESPEDSEKILLMIN